MYSVQINKNNQIALATRSMPNICILKIAV